MFALISDAVLAAGRESGDGVSSRMVRIVRFVEWNCSRGFPSNLSALRNIGCDFAVLCEVPEVLPQASLVDPLIDWQWVGHIKDRGLALAAFGSRLHRLDDIEGSGTFSSAATLDNGMGMLGIWASRQPGRSYADEVTDTITAYTGWLVETPAIVAGDFNASPFGQKTGSADQAKGALRPLFTQLEELGYVSLYHHYFAEDYGAETRATHFHHWKIDAGWHIDFSFLHHSLLPRLRSVDVGTHDHWVAPRHELSIGHSDHVPTIVDFGP